MKTIVLISCASKKLSRKAKAEELYTSPLFRLSLKYAKTLKPDAIYILSAKHYLLGLNREIRPYNFNLDLMSSGERKAWAQKVLKRLRRRADLRKDHFILLAGQSYRRYLTPQMVSFDVPLENKPIGKQLQFLKKKVPDGKNLCCELHELIKKVPVFRFPFDLQKIPLNGVYVLFEAGELGHGAQRIVRVGTHTGDDQLRFRMEQHFVKKSKDRSIFRKNIGRAILNNSRDPFLKNFLKHWNHDLTTREAKQKYTSPSVSVKQCKIERRVTAYIQRRIGFAAFRVKNKNKRLNWESKIISTVSLCNDCGPSKKWLGRRSPISKIQKSGLWNVNELYQRPLTPNDFAQLRSVVLG